MTFANASLMPDDCEYALRIQITQYQLKEATQCLTMLRRYSQDRAIRRQTRYIDRLQTQLDQYMELAK